MFLRVIALMHFRYLNSVQVKQSMSGSVYWRSFGNATLMWHISERMIFNRRTWKMHGAAAEPMSGWSGRVQLEILAGLMAYVMKDWIRSGTWNKTAWDYLLEDLELTCDNQLPMEHKLLVWHPLLRGWPGTLTGPTSAKLWDPAERSWYGGSCSARSQSLQKLLPAGWEQKNFWAPAWCCMGDDSLSCPGLSIRWMFLLRQKMNELTTWKQKGHLLILNWELIHNPMCYQRQHL